MPKKRSNEQLLEAIRETLNDARYLLENGKINSALMLLSLVPEVLGTLLDKKPAAARKQSQSRYESALHRLFPAKYDHETGRLYHQWRCHTIHSFLPGSHFKITDFEKEHLTEADGGILLFHPDTFIRDCEIALKKVERIDQ